MSNTLSIEDHLMNRQSAYGVKPKSVLELLQMWDSLHTKKLLSSNFSEFGLFWLQKSLKDVIFAVNLSEKCKI